MNIIYAAKKIKNDCLKFIIKKVGYVYHLDMEKHKSSESHVERPERIRVVHQYIVNTHFDQFLTKIPAREATEDEVKLCHDFVNQLKFQSSTDSDMYYNKHTKRASYLALGSSIALAQEIQSGKLDSGFALVRPPGHHACKKKSNGVLFF